MTKDTGTGNNKKLGKKLVSTIHRWLFKNLEKENVTIWSWCLKCVCR